MTYRGKPSHAALAPWEGINALDAMTVAHTAVGLLRRQLPPGVVVHGIVTAGGQAVNVIPALTRARCEVRALTVEQLGEASQRVRACFEAGGACHRRRARRSAVRYRWSCLRRCGSPSRFPVAGLLACGENGGRKAIEEVGIRCEALP
ncbi:peptidase dimerization domain-containing protein [Streptomyces sp. NPDC002206]